MKIENVMTAGCKYLKQDATLAEAAQLMATEDFGSAPVADGDRLVGVITDRDIVTRGVAKGCNPNTAKVSEFMSGKVYYCYDDQQVDDVAKNMAEMQVRRMPVVNRDKRLVGIVSLGDLYTRGADECAADALEEISKPPSSARQ